MKIAEIIDLLEQTAPLSYQEGYDNAGLLTGNASWECTGITCTLDATEAVIMEAKNKGCNLVITHHPIIFGGLKKITGRNYIEQTVIAAIKNDIAIYAIHTNLDNIAEGVNDTIAAKLNLINRHILMPRPNQLAKLFTFVPQKHADEVRLALFNAGAGNIGNYSQASFNAAGFGTFTAGANAAPFVGETGKMHREEELKIEVIFPVHLQKSIINALLKAHPYEEVAYDIIGLSNETTLAGSGLLGELPNEADESSFLFQIKAAFGLKVIRHTPLLHKKVKKVAVCGGAGSFLISNAIAANADFFITADVKYHEFFDADSKIVIADIGHWESEQFTIDLLYDILVTKFPTFAVLKTEVKTNPLNYFL